MNTLAHKCYINWNSDYFVKSLKLKGYLHKKMKLNIMIMNILTIKSIIYKTTNKLVLKSELLEPVDRSVHALKSENKELMTKKKVYIHKSYKETNYKYILIDTKNHELFIIIYKLVFSINLI